MKKFDQYIKINGEWFVDVDCNVGDSEHSTPVLIKVEEIECPCGQELTSKDEIEVGLCYQCQWLLDK